MPRKALTLKIKLAAALLALRKIPTGRSGVHTLDLPPLVDGEAAKLMTPEQIIGLFDFDHIVYAAFDGGEHPSNLIPRLREEHREKTAKRDIPAIAKAKRLKEARDPYHEAMGMSREEFAHALRGISLPPLPPFGEKMAEPESASAEPHDPLTETSDVLDDVDTSEAAKDTAEAEAVWRIEARGAEKPASLFADAAELLKIVARDMERPLTADEKYARSFVESFKRRSTPEELEEERREVEAEIKKNEERERRRFRRAVRKAVAKELAKTRKRKDEEKKKPSKWKRKVGGKVVLRKII